MQKRHPADAIAAIIICAIAAGCGSGSSGPSPSPNNSSLLKQAQSITDTAPPPAQVSASTVTQVCRDFNSIAPTALTDILEHKAGNPYLQAFVLDLAQWTTVAENAGVNATGNLAGDLGSEQLAVGSFNASGGTDGWTQSITGITAIRSDCKTL